MWDRLRRRFGASTIVAVFVAAFAFVLIGACGGLARAPDDGLPVLAAGAALDAGPWRVRPLRAWQGERCLLDGPYAPTGHRISVEVELVNLSDRSSSAVAGAFVLQQPAPDATPPSLELVRDRAVLGALHPGMPERVVLCWSAAPAATDAVALTIRATRYKERDNLQGGAGWFDPHDVAHVRLPLGAPDPDAVRGTPR
jgi:hypothetical protein